MSVLTYLDDLASNAVLSKTEKDKINTSISTLQTRLNNHFDNVSEHFKFGSSKRGTILPRKMDANSDIDYMVVFSDNDCQPQAYLDRLKVFVEKYYSSSEIKQSHPTIVLELNHIKFELVPAIYKGFWEKTLHIPAKASDWNKWIETDPNDIEQKLIDKNENNNYKIKPLIRLVKYWNAENGYPFASFGLEKHIINKGYSYSCTNLKDYLFEYMLYFAASNDSAQWVKDKVARAKTLLNNVKYYENQGQYINAETEIKKLIPEV